MDQVDLACDHLKTETLQVHVLVCCLLIITQKVEQVTSHHFQVFCYGFFDMLNQHLQERIGSSDDSDECECVVIQEKYLLEIHLLFYDQNSQFQKLSFQPFQPTFPEIQLQTQICILLHL